MSLSRGFYQNSIKVAIFCYVLPIRSIYDVVTSTRQVILKYVGESITGSQQKILRFCNAHCVILLHACNSLCLPRFWSYDIFIKSPFKWRETTFLLTHLKESLNLQSNFFCGVSFTVPLMSDETIQFSHMQSKQIYVIALSLFQEFESFENSQMLCFE